MVRTGLTGLHLQRVSNVLRTSLVFLSALSVAVCLVFTPDSSLESYDQNTSGAVLTCYAAPADWWGHWAEADIVYGLCKGIVTGYPDGTFKPEGTSSYAELLVLLLRALGEEEEARTMMKLPSRFSDVPTYHWAHGYLELGYAWGLLTPDSGGRALAGEAVTRAEMARIVWNAVSRFGLQGTKGLEQSLPFVDSGKIPVEALEAVGCLYALGVVTGDDTGAFRPDAWLTRAEALVICVRLLGVLGNRWDLEGEVVAVDVKSRTVTVDNGLERLSLRYTGDSPAVYQEGRRSRVAAIPVGSRVGVLFQEGAFPTLSCILVLAGQK